MEEEQIKEEAQKQVDENAEAKAKADELAKVTEEAERIEAGNAAAERLAKAKKAEETLGGQASAGSGKEEMTDEQYMEKVVANDVPEKP